MNLIKSLFPLVALASLALAAQTPRPQTGGHRHNPAEPLPAPTADPLPAPGDPARPEAARASACVASGCPRLDQHGHAPVNCEYKSGLATGFRCVLFCTYEDSQWGTLVDSARCK